MHRLKTRRREYVVAQKGLYLGSSWCQLAWFMNKHVVSASSTSIFRRQTKNCASESCTSNARSSDRRFVSASFLTKTGHAVCREEELRDTQKEVQDQAIIGRSAQLVCDSLCKLTRRESCPCGHEIKRSLPSSSVLQRHRPSGRRIVAPAYPSVTAGPECSQPATLVRADVLLNYRQRHVL